MCKKKLTLSSRLHARTTQYYYYIRRHSVGSSKNSRNFADTIVIASACDVYYTLILHNIRAHHTRQTRLTLSKFLCVLGDYVFSTYSRRGVQYTSITTYIYYTYLRISWRRRCVCVQSVRQRRHGNFVTRTLECYYNYHSRLYSIMLYIHFVHDNIITSRLPRSRTMRRPHVN